MTVTVRYRGSSDRRIITTAEFAAAGLGATTATWEKANGFEIDFDDVTGAWLLGQGEFESGTPNQTFGGLLQGALKTLRHDWRTQGWTPWTRKVVSADGVGATTPSVVNPTAFAGNYRGRITGQASSAGGNFREAYLRDNTNWENSRIKSLWWGGSVWDSGIATPQMGHIHRWIDYGGGVCRGYVVTNNIFASSENRLNQNVWMVSGAGGAEALTLGSNGGAYTSVKLSRLLTITDVERINFGVWINNIGVKPSYLTQALAIGDLITIDADDATFDEASIAINGIDNSGAGLQVVEPTTTSAVAKKFASGTINAPRPKQFWPYWVVSELVGTVLRVKSWPYGMDEPDWGDATYVKVYDASVASPDQTTATNWHPQGGVPTPNTIAPVGAGRCGLVAAHLRNSVYMEYGDLEFTQL